MASPSASGSSPSALLASSDDDSEDGSGSGSGASSHAVTARRGRLGDRPDSETTVLWGTRVHVRGLPLLAQAQGLQPDYYSPSGPGASQGASMGGDCYAGEGVYVLLRRVVQLIGVDLLAGMGHGMSTSSTSALAAGIVGHDTGSTPPGWMPLDVSNKDHPRPIIFPDSPPGFSEAQAFGISERCTAVESLDFLLEVAARLRTRFEAHLPPSHLQSVATFYSRAVLCVCLLKGLVYHQAVPALVPELGALPSNIVNVKWDLVRDATEANAYVPAFNAGLDRAAKVLNDRVASGSLPGVSRLGLWSAIVSHSMERVVEGISIVKKCSVPGRGLMALDAGTIYAAAAKLGPALPRFLPRDKGHVDAYVSAFYYSNEDDLLTWMYDHKAHYPLRHMRALLANGIGPSLKKAKLKDVTTALEAMYLAPQPTAHAQAAGGGGVGVMGGGGAGVGGGAAELLKGFGTIMTGGSV